MVKRSLPITLDHSATNSIMNQKVTSNSENLLKTTELSALTTITKTETVN